MIRNPGAILALKRVGDSQRSAEKYVDRQERLFINLLRDLDDDKIQSGSSDKEIVRAYGEPILVKYFPEDGLYRKRFLYRRPLEYFSARKVYLYFDSSDNLAYWELCGSDEQ